MSKEPTTPSSSFPTPKPKPRTQILTVSGPLSQIQKQIQILQKQIQLQKAKQQNHQLYTIQRQQKKIAKMRSFTFQTSQQQQPQIPIDGDLIRGSRLYTSQCLSCHVLDANSYYRNAAGPALGLIYRRRNGSDMYFKGYSDQILNQDFLWTSHKLNMYLKNPKALIPGTKCNFIKGGLDSEEDRVDIITFLKEYSNAMSVNLKMKMEKNLSKDYVQSKKETERLTNESKRK